MPDKSTLSPRRLEAQDKQRKALELRLEGWKWPAIAKALGYANHTGAINAVKVALTRVDHEEVGHYRALTHERLTKIVETYWPSMLQGDVSSAKVCLTAMKDIRELLGLDAASRVEHSGPEGSPIQHQVVTLDVGDITSALQTLRDAGAIRVERNGHSDVALDGVYPPQADA